LPFKDPEKWREANRRSYWKHRERICAQRKRPEKKVMRNKWHRNRWKILREQIIQLLGGKCIRCGFLDVRALQIDHVYGNGREHLHQIGSNPWRIYSGILKEIQAGSKDYQLLCANCNWIKRVENQEAGKN
jgi:hypothetical protein